LLIQIFISHCGINSAYESIWLGTPIICIPISVDQYDMGHRIQDAGVGVLLDKLAFTPEELRSHIETILENKNYSHNIKRMQVMMKLHGGVQHAADTIETVAQFGSKMFIPIDYFYPYYAYYNLDVYGVWFLIVYILRRLYIYCKYVMIKQIQKKREKKD
jgi:hypothetical protein